MRSSEEFALVLFQAWAKYEGDKNSDEIEWEDMGEWQQKGYLDQVKTVFEYLFEHGRISAYLTVACLEQLREEYKAYLATKEDQPFRGL